VPPSSQKEYSTILRYKFRSGSFLLDVRTFTSSYTASYFRRQYKSQPPGDTRTSHKEPHVFVAARSAYLLENTGPN
jgi:hypothetical protein